MKRVSRRFRSFALVRIPRRTKTPVKRATGAYTGFAQVDTSKKVFLKKFRISLAFRAVPCIIVINRYHGTHRNTDGSER